MFNKGISMIHNNNKKITGGCYWCSKKVLLFCLILLAFSCTVKAQEPYVVDRIVAVVNDDIITLMELKEAINPYEKKIMSLGYSPEEQRKMVFKVRAETINQLIGMKLTEQEIQQLGIVIDENEIDSAIERVKEANFFTDEELRKVLASEGSGIEEYREKLKQQMLKSKLVNYKIKSKIVITKNDIKKYYDGHKEQYEGKAKYHLRNIFMQVPEYAGDQEKDIVFKRMEEALQSLKQGKPFGDVASTYSELHNASKGGDLGVISIDVFSPQLQKEIAGMKEGEFTSILDTDQGFQIFFVEMIIKEKGKSFEDASLEIEEKLYNEIVDKKFQEWLEGLREEAHIKIIR